MATLSQLGSPSEASVLSERESERRPMPPEVDVRVVPLTVHDGRLRVALVGGDAVWSLPCGVPRPGGSLDSEARRVVRGTAQLNERYLEQLFTRSIGDERSWKVIVSYLALVDAEEQSAPDSRCSWFNTSEPATVSDEDRNSLEYAIVRLRAKIGYSTIAFHLLPPAFTLRELQTAYEAILGRSLDKRNFRRRVSAAELIEATGSKRRDGSHRPAVLYRFRADHDPATYLTPSWSDGNVGQTGRDEGKG